MKIERSCWYYDNQMLDRMTCVSLHANTYLDTQYSDTTKLVWKKYEAKDGIDKGGYCMIPLCTSILNEDFQVTVSNDWNSVGGDAVGEIWNGIKKFAPYTPYAKGLVLDAARQASEWVENNKNKNSIGADIAGYAAKGIQYAGDIAEEHGDNVTSYLNSVLVSQGTRFSYYAGTGFDFGNLQMRFTMFPIWAQEGENYTFLSVPQQLERLFPYVMGSYNDFNLKWKNDKGKEEDAAFTWLGWQKPPAGYEADIKDIDNAAIKGTLKLRIGGFYTLESLICSSINFNLSRQMVKKPEKVSWSQLNNTVIPPLEQKVFSPLCADVIITLRPATKYSDRSMRNFIYGLNTAGDANEGGEDLSRQMTGNLKTEIDNLDKIYNPPPQRIEMPRPQFDYEIKSQSDIYLQNHVSRPTQEQLETGYGRGGDYYD